MIAALLPVLLSAAPALYVSVDVAPRGSTAHLAARDSEEVELTLYALPPDPLRLVSTDVALPPAQPPPLLAAADRARSRLLSSAVTLREGLSAAGRKLAKRLTGAELPLAVSLPVLPRSQVDSIGTLLVGWRLETPESGWNYADLDLGALSPGVYALEAAAAGRRARTVFAVSTLTALVTHVGGAITVLAEDADTGSARGGVEVFAVHEGEIQLAGRTGADGLLTLKAAAGRLVLRADRELAVVEVPPSVHPAQGDSTGFVLLDRRAAQPGDALKVWSLWRALSTGEQKLSLPDSARAELSLRDWEGRTLVRQAATLSGLGILSAELDLPRGLAPGSYSVVVASGGERRSAPLELLPPGEPQLSVRCGEPELGADAGAGAACVARDGVGRPEPGVAIHWFVDASAGAGGTSEPLASGEGLTDSAGRVSLRSPAAVSVRAEAVDALGRSATYESRRSHDRTPRLVVHPERRLLRPTHAATISLDALVGDEPLHGRAHVVANMVHMGPNGDSQAGPLVDRWIDLDPHGHGTLTLTPTSTGYVEVTVTTEPLTSLARETFFVTESGGDIPATPERLTLVPEVGDRRRGEDARVLILTPFESGAVLLAFEPPVLPPQSVAVHGYSGVAHLTLPLGPEPLVAIAVAVQAGRLVSDRLQLLHPARTAVLSTHVTLDHPAHAGGREALSVESIDELGHPLAGQAMVTLVPASDPEFPSLLELLEPPGGASGFAMPSATVDSLGRAPVVEPQDLVPYGPPDAAAPRTGGSPWLQVGPLSEAGRMLTGLPPGDGTVLALAVAGPDEIGDARLHFAAPTSGAHPRLVLPGAARPGDQVLLIGQLGDEGCQAQVVSAPLGRGDSGMAGLRPIASTCEPAQNRRTATLEVGNQAVDVALEREGRVLDRRQLRVWSLPTPGARLADRLAEALAEVPATGPSADLACAAVRALGAIKAGRAQSRGPLARLAQLEGLAGGFGDAAGELRRDLAALRGLQALGASGDPELLTRTRARVGSLTEGMVEDDPDREQALAAVAAGGRDTAARPQDLETATPEQLALWLSGARPRARDRAAANDRVAALVGRADVLGLAELAVAGAILGARVPDRAAAAAPSPTLSAPPPVVRSLSRLDPGVWTQEALDADDEPPAPRRTAVSGPLAFGDELEITLRATVEGHGTFCLRDFPAAGLTLEGAAADVSASGEVLLCGMPNAGRLEVSYRARLGMPGRFAMPAAVFGAGLPRLAAAPTLEVTP